MNLTSRRMWWRGRASWTRLHCVICCELATLHGVSTKLHTVCFCNKCIGVDTKAAARQSPYCIKKQNKHKIWRKKTIFNKADGILTPCTVACGYGIMTVDSPSGSTLQCNTWMICHWIRPNVRHSRILHLVSTISPQSTCHSAPVYEILSESDHPRQKKWRNVDYQDGGSQPSWDCRDPIMGSLKSPVKLT